MLNRQLTIKDIVEFIVANKGKTTFMGYSLHEIVYMIKEALADETLFYEIDKDGNISGIIIANKSIHSKILFVTENLAMSIQTLKRFAIMAKDRFPGYKLEAIRHGKHRKFSDKFYNKLTK